MEMESLMAAAIQSSFLLGLLHGVNPCGHSWLVLVPFVSGERRGGRVILLTAMFLAGTTIACLILGASLGAVSQLLPQGVDFWVEVITSMILMVVGILLLYNPHILHSHEHHHHDAHHHDTLRDEHHHEQTHHCGCRHEHSFLDRLRAMTRNRKTLPTALFLIGFVNMIVPCPTAAVMYTYAINSGNTTAATLVFGAYAISTAIAVGAVIYLLFKATTMAGRLQKEWVEPLIMRLAGFIIIFFSGYGLYQTYAVSI